MNESRTCASGGANLTQPRSSDVHGVTYFIRSANAIKIGFASKLSRRLGGLQTGHYDELEVLGAFSADDVDEYASHQKFAHLRIRGEWFRAEKELLDFIDSAKFEFGEAAPHKMAPRRKAIPNQLLSGLHKLRSVHGPNTPIGNICSNLTEMIPNYQRSTDPTQRANLAKSIGRMSGKLKELTAQFH